MSPHVCTPECGAVTVVMCWACRKELGRTHAAHANALLREHDLVVHAEAVPQTQWQRDPVLPS